MKPNKTLQVYRLYISEVAIIAANFAASYSIHFAYQLNGLMHCFFPNNSFVPNIRVQRANGLQQLSRNNCWCEFHYWNERERLQCVSI